MSYAAATSAVPGIEPSSRRTFFLLLGCMALPIIFSLSYFLHQSLRLDEAQSLWQTSRGFADVLTIVAGDVHVPFYHLLLRLWRLYIGDSVGFARLFSLVAYVGSIPALYLLGKTAHSKRV